MRAGIGSPKVDLAGALQAALENRPRSVSPCCRLAYPAETCSANLYSNRGGMLQPGQFFMPTVITVLFTIWAELIFFPLRESPETRSGAPPFIQ